VTKLLAGGKPVAALCLVLVALVAAPADPANAATWNGRYSVWRQGAFTEQYIDYSCVGASIQIMLNLVKGTVNRSKTVQLQYLAYANSHSKYPPLDQGADPQGWAEALVHYGAGNGYGWAEAPTLQEALNIAAKQMRQSGKAVGLLVHSGDHAWLMTGFMASADPATTDNFTVTQAEVLGPLWPLGTFDGQPYDPAPGTWMTLQDLSTRFDPYHQTGQSVWDGQYVMVVPQASSADQGGSNPPPPGAPNIQSVAGFAWVFDQLAKSMPVRDYLWAPPLLR